LTNRNVILFTVVHSGFLKIWKTGASGQPRKLYSSGFGDVKAKGEVFEFFFAFSKYLHELAENVKQCA
jgi:hypothetical protein